MDWKKFDTEKPNNNEEVLVWFNDTREYFLAVYGHHPTGPDKYWSCESDGECYWPDLWLRIEPPKM